MEQPNFEYIDALADGDEHFRNKLLLVIQNEFPQELESYQDASQSNNFFAIAELVHKLKNKISMLGLNQGYRTAQAYEEGLKKGDLSKREKFEAVLDTMTHFIKSF